MNNLVFDIGAHKGNTVHRFFAQGYKKVVAVEPNPQLADALNLRFRDKDFVLVEKAVSSYEGEIEFYIGIRESTLSTVSKDWITDSRFTSNYDWWDEPLKVKCTNLDNLINEFGEPDLIKIDVENHEHEVLEGLSKDINSEIRFEWHEEKYENAQKACGRLVNLGYSKFACVAGIDGSIDDFTPEEITGAGLGKNFEYDVVNEVSAYNKIAKGILLYDKEGLSWESLDSQMAEIFPSPDQSHPYWGMIFAKK